MKIVIIGPAFPLRGGIADFNEALACSLIDASHSVTLFSFYYQYPSFLFPGRTQFAGGEKPDRLTIRSTISSVNPLSWRKTALEIASLHPDLVIVRFWLPFMGPALGTIAKLLRKKNIPIIAITDNVIPHEKRIGDSLFTRFFLKHCDGFVTMSRSVLEDLEQFTQTDKKIFLPHPIYNIFGDPVPENIAREMLGLQAEDRLILFFGFIRKYKGLDLLLDAMLDQRILDKNIKLLIAGEFYDDPEPYLSKIKNSALKDSVILHSDFIDKSKVKYYFCSADLIVQPYITATQSGITQVAYHFGRPMLVTNVGGLAEIVQDKHVGYVTRKFPSAIADAIFDFYENSREGEFSANVEREKERFSWNHFVNGLLNLYDKIRKQ